VVDEAELDDRRRELIRSWVDPPPEIWVRKPPTRLFDTPVVK
jgi:hypothetical protein